MQTLLGPSWLPKLAAIISSIGLGMRHHPSASVSVWADTVEAIGIALLGMSTRQNNVSSEQVGAAKSDPAAASIAKTLGVLLVVACVSTGCARFVGKTETRNDGTSYTTFRAYTFFDSKNELSKLAIRQTTTNKLNQSFGLSELKQEASGTNFNALVSDIVGAAVKAAKTP